MHASFFRTRLAATLLLSVVVATSGAAAQSPSTAAIVVLVVDQTGGVVSDAGVTVANTATGATREVTSGSEGAATITALALTGTYTIHVTKTGFTAEDVNDLGLRAGETATVKVTLVASGVRTDVVVFGTNQGVRADAQIGRRLDSGTLDEIPILGRKVTTVPLFNSAFRQGKGTGDLFVNATYFITAAGSRRTTTFMLDGASNDEAWGRQTMLATVPIGAVQEVSVLANAFSSEYGWTWDAQVDQNLKSVFLGCKHVLPYLEQQQLYQQFKLDQPWDSAHNQKLIVQMPRIFQGLNQRLNDEGKTTYLVPSGKDTLFPPIGTKVRLAGGMAGWVPAGAVERISR
jgi:hypothetical protein